MAFAACVVEHFRVEFESLPSDWSSPMKLFVVVTAAILCAGLIGWAVYDPDDLRHKTVGYSEKEITRSQQEFETAIAQTVGHPLNETKAQADARDLEYQIEAIEALYGTKTASAYRVCHTSTPKTKQDQLKCKRLDERFPLTASRNSD